MIDPDLIGDVIDNIVNGTTRDDNPFRSLQHDDEPPSRAARAVMRNFTDGQLMDIATEDEKRAAHRMLILGAELGAEYVREVEENDSAR